MALKPLSYGKRQGHQMWLQAAVCFTGVSVSFTGLLARAFTLVLLSRLSGMGRRSRTFASFSREHVLAMHAVGLICFLLDIFMTLHRPAQDLDVFGTLFRQPWNCSHISDWHLLSHLHKVAHNKSPPLKQVTPW